MAEKVSRSLGLAAYRVFSRRISRPAPSVARHRPDGQLLWMHASSKDRLPPLVELGDRLKSMRPELNLLISREGTEEESPVSTERTGVQVEVLEADHPGVASQFLDHWKPDICLWAGGGLMPNLVCETADRGVPMLLVDVCEEDFPNRRHMWFADLTRKCLCSFEAIFARNDYASSLLRRLGVPEGRVEVTDRLRNGANPAPFPEEELAEVTENLAGRPVWLAAHVHPDEFGTILAAHRIAQRLVHRMLLVLATDDPHELSGLARILDGSGLRYACWSIGDPIDDFTQVLITDGTEDLGLWYRVAHLTLMASSLLPDKSGRDPLEAASLGSGILFGPHVHDHLDAYSRLTEVGAARTVGDAEGLSTMLVRLIAPDHAAAMALAGWDAVTESAPLTDRLLELLQDRLDDIWTGDART